MKHATKIEWTQRAGTKGETLNPIRARNLDTGGIGHFCQHVSPGCKKCYAERLQPRFRNPIKYRPQDRNKVEIFLDEKVLTKPLRWRAPRTIFWCSMTDYGAPWVPDDWLDKIYAVCALTPHHTHQLLTKYPERIRAYFAMIAEEDRCLDGLGRWHAECAPAFGDQASDDRWTDLLESEGIPLNNMWLGTSCEDQRRADERIPHLLATPAAVRFISYEPALEAIDFTEALPTLWPVEDVNRPRSEWDMKPVPISPALGPTVDWIIAGGESVGRDEGDQRLIDWDWFRSARDQCRAAGVAFFCKQGNKGPGWKDPIPEDLQIHEWPEA